MIIELIKSKLNSKLGKDVIWTFVGQVAIMLSHLLITKVLSNDLSVDGFGRYNIIRRSASVLTFVLLGGMGIAIPRYLSICVSKKQFRGVKITIIASLSYLLLVCLATLFLYILFKDYLCILVINNDSWTSYLQIFFYSFVCCLVSYLYAYYRGIGKFKEFNIVQIYFQFAIMFPLLFHYSDVILIYRWWALLEFGLLIIFTLKEIYQYRSLNNVKVTYLEIKTRSKELTVYSLPRLVGDFFLFAYSAFPLIYIGKVMTLQDVSFFSVGITLFTLATPIFSFLGVILLPLVSQLVANNNYKEADRLTFKLLKVYLTMAVTITMGMIVLMNLLVPIFFSNAYINAVGISRILSFSIIPSSLYYLYRNPIDAVSVKPYNTYILAICFGLLILFFELSSSLEHFAYSYFTVTCVQGLLSWIVWKYLLKNKVYNK